MRLHLHGIFSSQFHAGGSGPLKRPLPTKLLLSREDIQADHLDVPATGQALELTRLEKPGP